MRSERKQREDIWYAGSGGITDLIDNMMKQMYYINDDEYDFICEHATDEELSAIIIDEKSTISEIKTALNLVDSFLDKMK